MTPAIDLTRLPAALTQAVRDIAQRIRAAGGRALLVGGAVRDLLMDDSAPVKDVDLEVFGLPADTLRALLSKRYALDLVGLSFGVLKIHHLDIDISLPRRESKSGLGHKGFEIASDPFLSVAEAAQRRDFTLNALYYDPLTDELIDPTNGLDDLRRGILRHISDHFREDPLRVLRGMQFIARFNLTPAPETVALCRSIEPEGLPPERQFEEWAKLLVKGNAISRGLAFLRETGWVTYYPELAALIGCRQDPVWHAEGDVWNHTCRCLDAFAQARGDGDPAEDLIVGLAVLCHDFGKPATTAWLRGRWRSPGHDTAGLTPTRSFLRRLTNEERILRDVPPLVTQHMQPFALWKAQAGDAAVRRLAVRVKRIDRLIRVARADDEGRLIGDSPRGNPKSGDELIWLANAAERLRIAAEAPKPLLMGRHLIERGYKPSAQFGLWLAASFEAQLDGAFSDLPGALEHARTHILPPPPAPAAPAR